MDAIERLIAVARRRSRWNAAIRRGVSIGIVLASVALLLVVLDRLPAAPIFDWWWLAPAFVVIFLIDIAIAWWMHRAGDLPIAADIDGRLGLDDRISTALHCSGRDDPISRAAMADGVAIASDPRTGERLRRTWQVRTPASWLVIPAIVLVAILAGFMGQADVFAGGDDEGVRPSGDVAMADDGMEEVLASIEDQPLLKEQLADVLDELEAEQAFDPEQTRQEQQLEALKRMTELQRHLEELTSGEVAQSMDSLRKSLKDIDVPQEGPASEMLDALSEGDFEAAAEALQSIEEELASGALDPQQRKELSDELDSLSQQLQQQADDSTEMKEALRQAGLEPQLADDAEALEQAMEQADQLSEQQKQQLKELVESNEMAEQDLRELSEAAEEMSKNCEQGSDSDSESQSQSQSQSESSQSESQSASKAQSESEAKDSGSGSKLSKQLSKMDRKKKMLQQAKKASGECRSQCQSLGESLGNKPGSRSRGSEQQLVETETGTELVQAVTKRQDGAVVSEQPVDGVLRTGESGATFQEVISRSRQGFDEAFNDDRLPRKYHDLIKYYFGDAGQVTEAVEFDAERAESSTPADEAPPESKDAEESGSGE